MLRIAKERMKASAQDFQRVVWPAIRQVVGGGELSQVETDTAPLAKQFDRLAGIDWWLIESAHSRIQGIASRVQWEEFSWGTFTIRFSLRSGHATEYQKRMDAIFGKGDDLYPALWSHAYLHKPMGEGGLIACGITQTHSLFEYVQEFAHDLKRDAIPTKAGDATFLAVRWDATARCVWSGSAPTYAEWADDKGVGFIRVLNDGAILGDESTFHPVPTGKLETGPCCPVGQNRPLDRAETGRRA